MSQCVEHVPSTIVNDATQQDGINGMVSLCQSFQGMALLACNGLIGVSECVSIDKEPPSSF